jgi:hypothetical protein
MQFSRRDGIKRPPMRSLKELCLELGVSRHQMAALISHHPGCPDAELQHKHPRWGMNTYYNPAKFRRWFASIQK